MGTLQDDPGQRASAADGVGGHRPVARVGESAAARRSHALGGGPESVGELGDGGASPTASGWWPALPPACRWGCRRGGSPGCGSRSVPPRSPGSSAQRCPGSGSGCRSAGRRGRTPHRRASPGPSRTAGRPSPASPGSRRRRRRSHRGNRQRSPSRCPAGGRPGPREPPSATASAAGTRLQVSTTRSRNSPSVMRHVLICPGPGGRRRLPT